MNFTNTTGVIIFPRRSPVVPTEHWSGSYINNETAKRFLEVVNCGILLVLTISGLTMNAISFVVLVSQRYKNRANVVLLGLTVSDSMFLLATLLRKFSCIISKFDSITGLNYGRLMMPQVYLIGIMFARITSLLTVLISTERLAVVMWPLRTRMVLTLNRIKTMVFAIFIFTFLSFLPLFFLYETSSKYNLTLKRYVVAMNATQFYSRHRTIIDYYTNLVLNVIFRFLPCLIVSGTTTTLVLYLRRHIRWRIRSTNLNKADLIMEERRVTKTLIAISTLYVICLIPGTVITIARLVTSNFDWNGQYRNLFSVVSAINIILECINSSFNFIIYMRTSRSFASQFQTIRRWRECKRRDESNPSRHTHL